MNTLPGNYDAMEQLILDERITIKAIDIHYDLDLFLVILNSGAVLRQRISAYPRLHAASGAQLSAFEIIASGTGVHWPELDEDLSLKGFLTQELRNLLVRGSGPLAA